MGSPHSLSKSNARRLKNVSPGPFFDRWGNFPKGTVLPETQVQSCPRKKVSDFPEGWLPTRLYERNLEQNQLLASCCRHPENHEIEGFKSHPDEPVTDIYIFHCTCGRKHRVFCVGYEFEDRVEWK